MCAALRSRRVAIISRSRARFRDHTAHRRCSLSGSPIIASITRMASGSATSAIQSIVRRRAARSTISAAVCAMVSSSACRRARVKALAAHLRSRVCSGGSTSRML